MSLSALPDQTIPDTKKTKEWHMDHVRSYVTYTTTNNTSDQRKEMLKLARAYNAELSEEEKALTRLVTHPHGIYLGTQYVVYPLIQNKIEQIVGEFIQRPVRSKAYVMDKKNKNKKFDAKLDMLSEQMMREVTQKMQKDLGYTPETGNPQMQIPEDVESFFENDFKPLAEQVADGVLKIFLDVRKEKSKFKQLFVDYCIYDRTHARLYKKHGFTSLRKILPMDCDHDIDPYKVVQNDHEYFFENFFLTENEIYNTFPKLTVKQKGEVRKLFESISNLDNSSANAEELSTSNKYNGWHSTSNKTHRIRLVSAVWKSRKRINIKISQGKNDREFYKKVDEGYKPRKKEVMKHIDGDIPRHVVMLGPDLCLDWGIQEKRYSHIDDPYGCELQFISIIRDNTIGTSLIKSVAAKLYQLQEIASEVLFEIRMALKTAGDSRVLVYDVAQTPKEFTKGGYEKGLDQVMHHIKKDKLMVINSKQKGAKNSFNQFTSLDLSQKGAVQDLFNGLAIIEDLADKFIGMAPEREGQVGQYQTATGTDKAIRGSTARTEVIFTPFDEFLQAVMEKVILRAKHDYEKGEVLQYIFGEMKTKFLTLFEDFFLADFGLYLSDARKDKEVSDRIDRAAEMALSNSNTPEMVMGLIEVFEGDSAAEKKEVFKKMLAAMDKLRQEQEKAMAEANQNQLKADAVDKDKDRGITLKGHDKDRDVAGIYVQGKGLSDALKNQSAERIKAAELDQKANEEKKKEAS